VEGLEVRRVDDAIDYRVLVGLRCEILLRGRREQVINEDISGGAVVRVREDTDAGNHDQRARVFRVVQVVVLGLDRGGRAASGVQVVVVDEAYVHFTGGNRVEDGV